MSMMSLLVVAGLSLAAPETVELETAWRFAPDPGNVGVVEGWYHSAWPDDEWPLLEAGARWEDQGFPDHDGIGWYRQSVTLPDDWKGSPVWLHMGSANDACVIYCNGIRIQAYGERESNSYAQVPVIADLSDALCWDAPNVIAIAFDDFGGSGGIWHLPCFLTNQQAKLPLEAVASCHLDQDTGLLQVAYDLTSLGTTHNAACFQAAVLLEGETTPAPERIVREAAGDAQSWFTELALAEVKDTVRQVLVLAENPQGEAIAHLNIALDMGNAIAEAAAHPDHTVLNNFVTELGTFNLTEDSIPFTNPRDGWVFFRTRNPNVMLMLDEEPAPIVWRKNPDTDHAEAMQWLTAGEHIIHAQAATAGRLLIRTVPELSFCYYPSSQHIAPYPDYDWAYMERHVLPHVNMIVTRSSMAGPEFEQWCQEGRRWIANSSLPGLTSDSPPPVPEIYAHWAENGGAWQQGYHGLIVDEFLTKSSAHYTAWDAAVQQLNELDTFQNRIFYAWCAGSIYKQRASKTFCQNILDQGHRFAWEVYLPEAPDHAEAASILQRELRGELISWERNMPEVRQAVMVTLGYLSAPPETLNRYPSADYHVFMDMQFRLLATDPAFKGIFGIMEYMAAYADEESLRWAHQLIRHYCIEGNTSPYTQDPYDLPHLQNPDFAEGLATWTISGDIAMGNMEGFSYLQGRYPRIDAGDQYCVLQRNTEKANTLEQRLMALEPGRLYSVKAITANLDDLHEKAVSPLDIQIRDAELVPEHSFDFAYPSCYSHEIGPYTRGTPAWLTFHRRVFRATGDTAQLRLGDGVDTIPAGRRTALNFIEVQPFR